MTKIYLDSNVIIYIENEKLSKNELTNIVKSTENKFFFSAAHIQEANEITSDDNLKRENWVSQRMRTIEEITENNYLYHQLSDNNVYELIEKPENVLKTITDIPGTDNIIKLIVNSFGNDMKKQIRESMGLDSGKMNIYSPKEVIDHLNKKLESIGNGQSFIELINQSFSYFPQNGQYGIHNKIAGMFELLDMLGYWTDKHTTKSNYARLWDSNHTFFASFCDFFISDDKRTRNKAKVVYDLYGIETKVISTKVNE